MEGIILVKSALRKLKRNADKLLSDEKYISRQYKKKLGKELNLNDPKTFNEKLQWMKLHYRKEEFTDYVDKYEVRNFVKEKIGNHVLNDLYGVYMNPEEIDLEKLPNSFVLKVNHGSGQQVICEDKKSLDWEKAKKDFKKYLKQNYFYQGREWAYKNVDPKIISEKFLVDESGKELKDYKIFCFNGDPKIIQVDTGRFTEHKRNLYDLDWNLLEFKYVRDNTIEKIEKPSKLNEMIDYARTLSEGIPFVRVDFYQVGAQVIFGEMTFFPENAAGKFYPEIQDEVLGSWIKLPNLNA